MARKGIIDDIKMYFNKNYVYWRSTNSNDIFNMYFLNISDRILEGHFLEFDSNGIPMRNHGNGIGKQYNPVTITSYALGVFQIYQETKDDNYLNEFIKLSDWLVNNQSVTNNIGVWYYNFNWKGLKKPWISGMAQGEALSVLSRAYIASKDVRYLETAYLALNSFKYDIDNGGVISYIDHKMVFFEEYVKSDPTHVLNGFLYALIGIHEFFELTNDKDANTIFNSGIDTLEYILPKYDCRIWSKYNLNNKPFINVSSYMYHQLHIIQLKAINKIVESELINKYCIRWEKYTHSFVKRMIALSLKSLYKIINK